MSLEAGYQLSQDPGFRGKVLIAVSKVALSVISGVADTEPSRRRAAFAKEVLRNVHHYAERLNIIVASSTGVDTSSTDTQIETAVRNALIALVQD